MSRQNAPRRRMLSGVAGLLVSGLILPGISARPAAADSYQRISGEGSSWAANAIDAMRVDVQKFGITVDYNPSGSTAGRTNFRNGTVDSRAASRPLD